MEGRDIKKRKLGNANSNSKTLGNRADEALKKNHKKWLKRSTILTYSILETSNFGSWENYTFCFRDTSFSIQVVKVNAFPCSSVYGWA